MRISNNFQSPTQSNHQKSIQPNFQGFITDSTKDLILRAAKSEIAYIRDNNPYRGPLDLAKLPSLIMERANKLIEEYEQYIGKHNVLTSLHIDVIKKPLDLAWKAIIKFENPLAPNFKDPNREGVIIKESEYIAASGLDFFKELINWLSTFHLANNIDNDFISMISKKVGLLLQLQKQNPKDGIIQVLLKDELNNLNIFNKNSMKHVPDDIPNILVKKNPLEPESQTTEAPIDIIKNLFYTNPKVTVPELSVATGLSRYHINKLIEQLLKEGFAQKHGGTKGVFYTTKDPIEIIKGVFATTSKVTYANLIPPTGLSRYEIRILLNKLVEEGYIKKHGHTNHSYYTKVDKI